MHDDLICKLLSIDLFSVLTMLLGNADCVISRSNTSRDMQNWVRLIRCMTHVDDHGLISLDSV